MQGCSMIIPALTFHPIQHIRADLILSDKRPTVRPQAELHRRQAFAEMHLIPTAKNHQRERTFCWRVLQEVIMSTESNERTKVELHGSVTSQELIGNVDCVLTVRHDN